MGPRHPLTARATAALALCASASLAQTTNAPASTDTTTVAQQRVTIEGATTTTRSAAATPRRKASSRAELLKSRPAHAARRGARVRARRHRHAALGRRQGQPVLPARLQPRPRHRLRDQRRRHAGQHAQPRPRPGLHRPQLPDARAGAAHRIPQGPVLRQPDGDFASAGAADIVYRKRLDAPFGQLDARRARLPARRRRRLDRRRPAG